LAFCLPNQKCEKILMEKMIYNEILKTLFFEKKKSITKKKLCPQKLI
jgi:hypothetical protein